MLNKSAQVNSGIIMAIVGVIIGLILLIAIVPSVVTSSVDPSYTQTITLTNNTNTTLANDNIDTLYLWRGAVLLNETEQYTLDDTLGRVQLIDNAYNGSATTTYTYDVMSGLTRLIVLFIPVFAGIFALVLVAGLIKNKFN